ncbi:MAG: tetratricopeptide repeat protein [Candidatus Omnitrophota bacterium]|jgi:tetratricopeptide (TPR) repeat protein
MAEYLCEMGAVFYKQGRMDEALMEFNKALIIDPDNPTAKNYISNIFKKDMQSLSSREKPVFAAQQGAPAKTAQIHSREDMMNRALNDFNRKDTPAHKPVPEKDKKEGLQISGEAQMSMGVTSDHFYWKRANYDLNERNWRMNSNAALDRGFNTYNPNIYQGVDLNLDTANEEGFNFHSGIAIDPWSFTGKSDKRTLTTAFGDTVDVQLKYWSNTGYTVNDILYSNRFGNTFSVPELKVVDGKVNAFTLGGAFSPADTLNVEATDIDMRFQPVRELWVDYTNDGNSLRVFPIAYQDQAFTSDDPLAITNHHKWWEGSLWLRTYKPGTLNSGASPQDFRKGFWDNSLVALSKDGDGTYLTALRGASFTLQPFEGTTLSSTVATPKNLWQEYGEVDNAISATRLKQAVGDRLVIGSTLTTRHGFLTDPDSKLDSENYVAGVDMGYELIDGVKAQAEVLASRSRYDLSDSEYETKSRGSAYYFSLMTRYPRESLKDVEFGYDGIKRGKEEGFLFKTKWYGAHLDDGFDSALSSFRNTRDDMFWSRYITFRKPFSHFGGYKGSGANFDEVWATRLGDGIDTGRNVLGTRLEFQYEDAFSNLLDVRNVHDNDGKFIENVARDEATLKVNDKLTVKGLGIYHKLPRTKGGIDPFMFDVNTGRYLANSSVPDGEECSLKTGAIGLEYAFYDWLVLNGVYQRTNDYYLMYGNFPNGVYNSSNLGYTYSEYDRVYRDNLPFLYDQGYFPQAPYSFYNIFKSGLRIVPIANKLEIYLDYTRNEFEMAGQNSENMNHIGCEFVITPTDKLGLVFKYNFSRAKEVAKLIAGNSKMINHHNFFSELYYSFSENDLFALQYGEGYISGSGLNYTLDPFGGSLTTLDTQHIIRAYYRRKF